MPITINPKVAFGKPVIAGTRISVEFVLELLGTGMSLAEILKEYPHLTKQDVLDAIQYASKTLKHEELIPFSRKAS